MKLITSIVLTILLSFAAGLFSFMPWWGFVVAAFIVAVAVHQKPWKAFLSGFIALFALWFVLAVIKDTPNQHILSTKVASILPLGGSYWALIAITAFIGALLAGMAALTGSYLRKK